MSKRTIKREKEDKKKKTSSVSLIKLSFEKSRSTAREKRMD